LKLFETVKSSALQPVCTVHHCVHQNVRGVHHFERVHTGASPTCHTKYIPFTKTSCYQKWTINQPMAFRN